MKKEPSLKLHAILHFEILRKQDFMLYIIFFNCSLLLIVVDGNFTQWAQWSSCSKTCGNGLMYRSRTCSNPLPQFGGKFCEGNDTESRPCNQGPCCK